MLNDLKEDRKNGYISDEELKEYSVDYKIELSQITKELDKIKNKLDDDILVDENIIWLDKFIVNEKILELNKKVVDEFINEIVVYDENTIKVTFKYENEYILALDFINKSKCDII